MSRIYESSDVILRTAQLDDVEYLRILSRKFVVSRPIAGRNAGFLLHPLPDAAWPGIVAAGHAVAAFVGGEIAGFYVIDHYALAYDEATQRYLRAFHLRAAALANASPSDVAFGCQAVVDEPHQGTGLRQRLLAFLRTVSREQFTHLFSKIHRSNSRALTAHHRDGWKPVAEDGEHEFVFLSVYQ